MPPHIDKYTVVETDDWREPVWGEMERFREGQAALDYGAFLADHGYPLGRFNGYKYLTGVHEDGECNIYEPRVPPHQMPGVLRVIIQPDGTIDRPLPSTPRSPMD